MREKSLYVCVREGAYAHTTREEERDPLIPRVGLCARLEREIHRAVPRSLSARRCTTRRERRARAV